MSDPRIPILARELALMGQIDDRIESMKRYAESHATRILADLDAAGWRPIDTAPKDGDARILVWVANGGRDGRGAMSFGRVTDRGAAYADGHSGGWDITHWMPLPPAPRKDGK